MKNKSNPTNGRKAEWFTPGPWYWKKGGNILDGSGYSVAETINDVNDESNARLISAAPELLAALKGLFKECAMLHKYGGDGNNAKEADAAIAFAEAAIRKAQGGKS